MLYRLYQPGDFAQLYAVEELCFEPPFRFSRALMRKLIANPNSAAWIAEENAKLAGFAIVEWEQQPESGAPVAYIQTVEVAPAHRGQGIGSELMRLSEDSALAAGAAAIWLHVDLENSAAIRLYESRGYTRKGREEHFYARHRAALVYAKPLSHVARVEPSP
jgi:ribosomal protein S18 acetylase RimI-like enzyme